jgi:hypothetical protein
MLVNSKFEITRLFPTPAISGQTITFCALWYLVFSLLTDLITGEPMFGFDSRSAMKV